MTKPRAILTIIHADTDTAALKLIPPERPGWRREISVETFGPGLCYRVRCQVVETETAGG